MKGIVYSLGYHWLRQLELERHWRYLLKDSERTAILWMQLSRVTVTIELLVFVDSSTLSPTSSLWPLLFLFAYLAICSFFLTILEFDP